MGLDDLLSSPTGLAPYQPQPRPPAYGYADDGRTRFFSAALAENGYPGFPTVESLELPFGPDDEYPLILSTGDRIRDYHHSQYRNIPSFRRRRPEPKLEIHPMAAKAAGLTDGDLAEVSTRYGRLEAPVELTQDVRPDLLRMSHGWEEADCNVLCPLDHFDPISGFPWLKSLPAALKKVEAS